MTSRRFDMTTLQVVAVALGVILFLGATFGLLMLHIPSVQSGLNNQLRGHDLPALEGN